MTIILLASALNSMRSVSPAVRTRSPPTINAKTNPANQLTKPPSSADNAPCIPATIPAASAIRTALYDCQRKTVRNGDAQRRERKTLPLPPRNSKFISCRPVKIIASKPWIVRTQSELRQSTFASRPLKGFNLARLLLVVYCRAVEQGSLSEALFTKHWTLVHPRNRQEHGGFAVDFRRLPCRYCPKSRLFYRGHGLPVKPHCGATKSGMSAH